MVKLGIIAFANHGGLAIQTKRLCTMLHPSKVMVIDSKELSPNKEQDFTFFKQYDWFKTKGFPPTNPEILRFIEGLDVVLVVENPYNFYLIHACREKGIKTIVQANYEFCENVFAPHLPVPDLFLMPSYWKLEEMQTRFNAMYLPPPIEISEFAMARFINSKRRGKCRFLHIIGTLAYKDRNGTLDLLKAVELAKGDFELVIKSQHVIPTEYISIDKRISYEFDSVKDNQDLYSSFDALVLPRRYGGLSLTTNEALMSGLPTIMTDIVPNNDWLPKKWLVKANHVGTFKARAEIDLYSVDHQALADKLDEFTKKEFSLLKRHAFMLGKTNFSPGVLRPQYRSVIK